MSSLRQVVITSGDIDGIGLEVSLKALRKIGPQRQTQFILFRSKYAPSFRLPSFKKIQISRLNEVFNIDRKANELIEIVSDQSPATWVEETAKACLSGAVAAMATAPLSKQEIQRAGFSDIGHTDILKRISQKKTAFMAFMGPQFNVLLTSGHIPVEAVEKALTRELIQQALAAAHEARSFLPATKRSRPLGVLGLNPHAGDHSLIGRFDQDLLKPLLLKTGGSIPLVGPLVPDVAFLPENWNKYSVYVALYHDQGLIPFKMIHGFDAGVHLTLGLPIKRSSVDHGTAKEIFGQNKANPGSMIEALRWAVKLAHKG